MRAIYVLVDEEDYLELRKRLLEERKSLAQWVRERIKEYLALQGEGYPFDDIKRGGEAWEGKAE